MNRSDRGAVYPVRMETRQWLFIDATMDNEVSVEAEDCDPRAVVDLGNSIRQAGWDQIPGWPHDEADFQTWPAPGQTSTVVLSAAQWDLVISGLVRWAAVSEGPEDTEAAAEQSGAIVATVRAQLTEQGWSSP